MINKLCVIGAGTIGAGIAQVAAEHGITTVIRDLEGLEMIWRLKRGPDSVEEDVHQKELQPVVLFILRNDLNEQKGI